MPPEKPDYLHLVYQQRPFLAFLDLVIDGKFIPYNKAVKHILPIFKIEKSSKFHTIL